MLILTAPSSNFPPPSTPALVNVDDVLGVAVFDINGLPCDYFVTNESPSTAWVQIVFQALGLRSLLASSLQVEGFYQITINLSESTAMVVRRKHDYIALLLKAKLPLNEPATAAALNQWISNLQPSSLSSHPRFQAL